MKLTLSWLKEHLDTSADTAEIARRMIALGLEVESVADPAKDFQHFVVGYVVEAKPHPNADRLRLCLVDTGSERMQVVCGAPNARTGMKGVFAPAGSRIPGTGLRRPRLPSGSSGDPLTSSPDRPRRPAHLQPETESSD